MKDEKFKWFLCILLCIIPIAIIHVSITPTNYLYGLFFNRLLDSDNLILYLISLLLLCYSIFRFFTSGDK